ncbi:MAG: metallophosphoesterase [Planctomycetes bacterium]|nr:metallophosphoesterase [Planctomycetota bacterium]
MAHKTLILSDLHLGHRASRAPRFLATLSRAAAGFDRVIVNGDAVDEYETHAPTEDARRLHAELTDILTCRGGAPEFLTGNHDPAISAQHHAYLEEPGLLVFHGDYANDRAVPWDERESGFAARYRAALESEASEGAGNGNGGGALDFAQRAALFRRVQVEFFAEHPEDRGESGLVYLLRHVLPPSRVWLVWRYVQGAPEMVARAAREFPKPVKAVAFGHIHRAGRWAFDGVTVYNTGSYMPFSKPGALVVEGERVTAVPAAQLAF